MNYPQNRPALNTLTSIRFIAAFSVFLFHINLRWPLSHSFFIKNVFSQGAVGMSLFFVLSGFVLTYNYYNLERPIHKDYHSFIIKRFARIYPVYVVSGLAFLMIGMFNVHSPHILVKSFFLILTNIFLIQGWFPSLFSYWNDSGTWSLSVEAFCYFLFPLILLYLSKQNDKKLWLLLLIAYLGTLLPTLSSFLNSVPSFSLIYALPMYRLPEFIIGMIACLFFMKIKESSRFITFKIIIIFLLGTTWLGFIGNKLPNYVGHNIIIIPACTAFILLAANLKEGLIFKILTHKILIFLGEISYSFYLLQGIPIIFTKTHYDTIITLIPILKNKLLLIFFIFVISILFSILCYLFIEKPMRKNIIRKYTLIKDVNSTSLLAERNNLWIFKVPGLFHLKKRSS